MADNYNVNRKLENPVIRELFEKRKNVDAGDREAVSAIMNDLIAEIVINANFLSPVNFSRTPIDDGAGGLRLAPKTETTFVLLDNGKGERFFPLFTESEELAKWEKLATDNTIQIGFDTVASLLERNSAASGFVINPFSDNLLVNRQVAMKWMEKKQFMQKGHAQHVITPDSRYEFHTLDPYPMLLSNKLCETAKSLTVDKMWLRGIELDGNDGYLLVVEFSGDRMSVFTELGNSVKQFLSEKSLHIIDSNEPFGKVAVENMIPIYSKN